MIMPEYDENFLLDCSNFEKQRWRSYNFKFKFKPLDNNSNYLLSPTVRYSPLKGVDEYGTTENDDVNSTSSGDYRHSFYGFPSEPVRNIKSPIKGSLYSLKRKLESAI